MPQERQTNSGKKRRAFLKAAGASMGAIALPGVASAASENEEEEEIEAASGGEELSLGGENAMSPEELEKFAKDMSDKYEEVQVQDVAPHVTDGITPFGTTPSLTNIGTVGAWNSDYNIKTPYGLTYTKVENAATLYRSNESDGNGKWHYFVWLWSKAEPQSKPTGGYWPYTWIRSDFSATGGAYVDRFSPSNRVDKHEKPISIGVSYGLPGNGPSVGISGSTEISEGYIVADDVDQGNNGEVGFKFRASGSFCRDVNTLNGTIQMTSDEKYEQYSSIPSNAFSWSVQGHTNGL